MKEITSTSANFLAQIPDAGGDLHKDRTCETVRFSITAENLRKMAKHFTRYAGDAVLVGDFREDKADLDLRVELFDEAETGPASGLVIPKVGKAVPQFQILDKLGFVGIWIGWELGTRKSRARCGRGLGREAEWAGWKPAGCGLPTVFDVLPEMKKLRRKAKDDTPSCSLAEALARQDLFINSTLATLGGQLLWHLLRHGGLNHHGYFVNLNAGVVRPIPCPSQARARQATLTLKSP